MSGPGERPGAKAKKNPPRPGLVGCVSRMNLSRHSPIRPDSYRATFPVVGFDRAIDRFARCSVEGDDDLPETAASSLVTESVDCITEWKDAINDGFQPVKADRPIHGDELRATTDGDPTHPHNGRGNRSDADR